MIKNIIVKKDEKKILPFIWTGSDSQVDYNITLTGRGAEVTLLMLLIGDGAKSVNIKTNVRHNAPDTKSRVIVKGVLKESSKADFEGLVKIEHGAKSSKTWLAAHMLLLSDEAGGRAVPNLEIAENEVTAGHAATVGKVNEIEIFYLMSRGLTRQAAERLVVEGFMQSILDEFPPDEAIKARKRLKWT